MTIEHETAAQSPRRSWLNRPLILMLAALSVASLAGLSARAALASTNAPSYVTPTRSLDILRAAYGAAAERPFREPRVVVAPTSAATWDLSDEVNMANHAWNPRAGRPWSRSDAEAMWPNGMDGFTNPTTGDVFVNAHSAVASTVPHELLHANSSPDFLLRVGVAVNEGVTEQLALEALATSGVRAEKVACYPRERELAAAITHAAGRDLLLRAYFNGGADLDAFVKALGGDTIERVKNAAAVDHIAEAIGIVESAR